MVKVRIAGMLAVIRGAASADAETRALWTLIQSDFYENQRVILESLDRIGALAPGLDVARAIDILWMLNHPDVWHLLVCERGWTAEQFEDWFAETTCQQLLARSTRTRRARSQPGSR